MLPTLDKKIILLIALVLVLGLFVGYVLGNQTAKRKAFNYSSKPAEKVVYKTSPLFNGQTANVIGKITKIDGSKIVVEDSKKQIGSFTLYKKVAIINANAPGQIASPSSNIKDIQLNKEALIYLQLIDGDYQVLSIAFKNFPDSTPSAKNAIGL